MGLPEQGECNEAAVPRARNQLRSDHPRVATTLNNFALVLEAQGEYAATEPLSRRNRSIYEKELGPDHRRVARSLSHLSLVLHGQ